MTRRLIPLWIPLALGLLLIVLHLALPHLVRNYLNEKMADMGDYQGHVEDVGLAWWRGRYRVEGLLIFARAEPWLKEIREASSPRTFRHAEWAATSTDKGRQLMLELRERVKKAMANRAS